MTTRLRANQGTGGGRFLSSHYIEEVKKMSHKSQERNMRRLAGLLGQDLGYIWGGKESGPNGVKKQFLNTGKVFFRALAKNLGLQEISVSSNAAGIGVSGDCILIGMWQTNGLYVHLSQPCFDRERVLLYRTVRHSKDYTGGRNLYLTRRDLAEMSYPDLLFLLASVREEGAHEWAA